MEPATQIIGHGAPPRSPSAAADDAAAASLCPLSAASASSSAAAAVAAGDNSLHGLVVARPASVALHDMSTLEATSIFNAADAAAAAGSVKYVAHLHGGGGAAVTDHQDGRLRLWRDSSRAPTRLRLDIALPTVADHLRRFPVPSNHVTVRRLWIEHADTVSGVAASTGGRRLFFVSTDGLPTVSTPTTAAAPKSARREASSHGRRFNRGPEAAASSLLLSSAWSGHRGIRRPGC